MKSLWLRSSLFVVALVPGLLPAQTPTPLSPPTKSSEVNREPQAPTDFNKMYEDIEILRRILDRKLTPLYPSFPSKGGKTDPNLYSGFYSPDGNTPMLLTTPDGLYTLYGRQKISNADQPSSPPPNSTFMPYPAAFPLRSLEGMYLKGQGVIYTATLASLIPPAKAEADSSAQEWRVAVFQHDSEWDSIRRQVRNEKAEPKKPQESKPPQLGDVLLRVLAANGHNFSQLGENESLTIVLTVHQGIPTAPTGKTGAGATKTEPNSPPARSDAEARAQDTVNLAMLGDLHLKQAKYGEAVVAFEKLLERAETPQQKALVHRRLAQCYLGLGQDEKASAELDQTLALMKKETEPKGKSAAKPATALPVKLLISAPKKLLEQMKDGKMSFEDFRRQASVELLRFGDRR